MRAKQLVNLGHLYQLPADQSERSALEPDAEQLVFMTRTVCVRLAQGHINLDLVTEAEGSYKCTPPPPGFTSCCMRYESITYRSKACLLTWGLLLHWTTCKTSLAVTVVTQNKELPNVCSAGRTAQTKKMLLKTKSIILLMQNKNYA